jgi:hypothetical protein
MVSMLIEISGNDTRMSVEQCFICSTLTTYAAEFFFSSIHIFGCWLKKLKKRLQKSCKKVAKKLHTNLFLVGNPACILPRVKVRRNRVTNTRQRANRGRVCHQNDVEGLLCTGWKKNI